MHIIRINFFWDATLRQTRQPPFPPPPKQMGELCFCMCLSDKKTTYKHIYSISFIILFRFVNRTPRIRTQSWRILAFCYFWIGTLWSAPSTYPWTFEHSVDVRIKMSVVRSSLLFRYNEWRLDRFIARAVTGRQSPQRPEFSSRPATI
jgi:hypothetical protein